MASVRPLMPQESTKDWALDEPFLALFNAHQGLHAVIARLDDIDRALLMCYLEDLSYARIGEILGISETTWWRSGFGMWFKLAILAGALSVL